jgi:hypothetical protein
MDISSDVTIDAPPEKVWAVLTDFAAYPSWNPFIEKLQCSTPLAVGGHLTATIHAPGKKAMTFTPEILAAEPDRELRWLGTVVHRSIFAGEHRHLLEPAGDGRTHYVQSEHFSGILVPFLKGTVRAAALGFAEMNAALKARVEAS